MFREILKILKKPNLLIQSIEESKNILKISYRMYGIANEALIFDKDPEEDIEQLDETINTNQTDIKRKILEYLVLEPNMDVATSLVLINIITNIERLGDYSKNIYQLSQLPKLAWKSKFMDISNELYEIVGKVYEDTLKAYMDADKVLAHSILERYFQISDKCKHLLRELASRTDVDGNLVVITLYIRYMKRISSHLMHVAQSVDKPFESIGFHEGRDDE